MGSTTPAKGPPYQKATIGMLRDELDLSLSQERAVHVISSRFLIDPERQTVAWPLPLTGLLELHYL